MVSDIELGKVVIADLDFRRVVLVSARRGDRQAGFCPGAPDQSQRLAQAAQRLSCPVDTLIGPNKRCSTGFHFDAPVG